MDHKRPKLWNGPHALGEGLVRGLELTGAPYLSARAGDVYAGVMQGKGEVKFGGGRAYMCVQCAPRWSLDHAQFPLYGNGEQVSGVWVSRQGGSRLNRKAHIPGNSLSNPTALYPSPVTLHNRLVFWGSSLGWTFGNGCLVAYAFVNTGTTATQFTRATVCVDYVGSNGTATRILEVEHNNSGFINHDVFDHNGSAAFIQVVGARVGDTYVYHLQSAAIVWKVTYDVNTGLWSAVTLSAPEAAVLSRISPTRLLGWRYGFSSAAAGPWARYWILDNDMNVIDEGDEPGVIALLFSYTTSTPPWLYSFRSRALAAPLNDGNLLLFTRAWRTSGTAPVGFDEVNTTAYPVSPVHVPHTLGVTIFRGIPGQMSVVARFSVPDHILDVLEVVVANTRVLALVVPAYYEGTGAGDSLSYLFYGNNRPHHSARLLYSGDNGVTWEMVDTGLHMDNLSRLSVAANGDFMVATPSQTTSPRSWNIYSFRNPSEQWKKRSTMESDPYCISLRSPTKRDWPKPGAVVEITKGRSRSLTPGQPWVSDDRVQPPWET